MANIELSQVPLLEGCTSEAVERIAALGELVEYTAGDVILRQGEPAQHFFVLLGGVVRVLIGDSSGQQITAKLFSPPSVFGEMEALTRTAFIESVEVIRKASVLRFDMPSFERVMAQHPLVTRNLLIDVCHRFRTSALNQAYSAFENVERRLANLISSYVRVFGTAVKDGVQIVTETLTQETMAHGIGVNEKSIRRTLKAWEEQGIIHRSGRYYIVGNRNALEALAGGEAPRLDYHSE